MSMALVKLSDGSISDGESWDMIDDELTPLALRDGESGSTAAVPRNYIGEVVAGIGVGRDSPAIDADVPGGEGFGCESFSTAVSSGADAAGGGDVTEGKGGDDVSIREDAESVSLKERGSKVENHELTIGGSHGSESFTTAKGERDVKDSEDGLSENDGLTSLTLKETHNGENAIPADAQAIDFQVPPAAEAPEKTDDDAESELAAYYDEKLMRWVFPADEYSGKTAATNTPVVPPVVQSPKTVDDAISEVLLSNVSATETRSAEKADEQNTEFSDLVESLMHMGFEKESILKAIENLRLAGPTPIDHDSVVSRMVAADLQEREHDNKSERFDLLWTLASMGFKKEDVVKAIDILHQEGAKEICEDTVIDVIDEMDRRIGRPWDPFVQLSSQDLRQQNQLLRRRTQRVARDIGASARELWTNVREESRRLRADLEEDLPERTAHVTKKVSFAAFTMRDNLCRVNEEHGITDKLATVAVVGGAALLALGNPRAGVGLVAAAGATLAAGEAMKKSSARSSSTYTRDYGLGEGVHID